jgi:hypothetical protein
MKKIFTNTIALFILSAGLFLSIPAFADDPPPPPTHGEVGDIPAGGGAPIGEGLLIFAVLGAAYGGYNWYKYHKARVAAKEQ